MSDPSLLTLFIAQVLGTIAIYVAAAVGGILLCLLFVKWLFDLFVRFLL